MLSNVWSFLGLLCSTGMPVLPSAKTEPGHVEWDGRKKPIAEIWDFSPESKQSNDRLATNLEVRGWEPKWYFVGRGKVKDQFYRCRMTGKFYPSSHYSVAPGWVEGMR
jgi:hypothetical protein